MLSRSVLSACSAWRYSLTSSCVVLSLPIWDCVILLFETSRQLNVTTTMNQHREGNFRGLCTSRPDWYCASRETAMPRPRCCLAPNDLLAVQLALLIKVLQPDNVAVLPGSAMRSAPSATRVKQPQRDPGGLRSSSTMPRLE